MDNKLIQNNSIFIDDSILDKPIYRIMPVSRFLQVLEKKSLTLVKPHKWDDPYENALLSSSFKISNGETGTISARDSVYGQCWTLHRETDAMWRIYSQNKDGIRITTTPRKLLGSLIKDVNKTPELYCFIGKVQYVRKSDMFNALKSIDLLKTDGTGIAKSLLYKRTEFKHENEIRLIYSGDDNLCKSDIFNFKIDPNQLFDRLLFDPRMDNELRTAFTLAIKNKNCNVEIKRSTLYDAPKNFTFNI